MKHIIYYTEFYNSDGTFLRKEESDAYFDTIHPENQSHLGNKPPIGCFLLLPKLLSNKLSKEHWANLAAKKPDYQLKYATLCEESTGNYSIYAIYERVIAEEKAGQVYSIALSMGRQDEVSLDLNVIPTDYDIGGEHVTLWDEVAFEGTTRYITDNYVCIKASQDPSEDRKIIIHHSGWTVIGKWETMEQVSKDIFVYHCHNSLFLFKLTINIEKEAGAYRESYEDYLE